MSNTITVERKKLEGLLECENALFIKSKLEEILKPTPTMTEADWQRVIDERFYVFIDGDETMPFSLSSNDATAQQMMHKAPEILRIKGHRQPHLKGHPHPEGDEKVLVAYNNGTKKLDPSRNIDWDDVKEYICLG